MFEFYQIKCQFCDYTCICFYVRFQIAGSKGASDESLPFVCGPTAGEAAAGMAAGTIGRAQGCAGY